MKTIVFIVPITWGKMSVRKSMAIYVSKVSRKCLKQILFHWMFWFFYIS